MSTHTGVGTGTYSVRAGEIHRDWHVIDADGLVLGRLAAEVARILRGKTKPTYSPHLDVGDHVIIVNADKVAVTGRKMTDKMYYWHTMYPGGFRERRMRDVMAKHPDRVITRAVKGMLPKTKLGRSMIQKLKVYAGPTHPHVAQNPKPLELAHTRLR